jgi:hypothetical protein
MLMNIFSDSLRKHSKQQEINLTDLRIASPCPTEWSKMAGDNRVRHCSECNLNVYNLSAMTEREVQRLLTANSGQRLCARFYRRADGTVLTQDCPWSIRAMARKVSRLATALLTAALSVNLALAKNKAKPVTCECAQTQQKDSGLKLTVTDQQGALIPNAEITLENKRGKEKVTGSTGPSGEWGLAKVLPGRYNIKVQSPGFRTFTSVVNVHDGMLLGLKLKLPIVEVSTTVTADAALIGTMGGITSIVKNPDALPIAPSGGQHSLMRP